MAELTISIKDETSARRWLEMVEGINQDYHEAMKDAADCLERMTDFCDGTMVDEIAKYGSMMLKAADQTFDTISKIAETVTSVISKVKDFAEGVVGGFKAIGKIFG